MTVENQVPYQSFTANGSQTNFALGFYVDDKNHFEVKKNEQAVTKNAYSYDKSSNSIVFNSSPSQGDVIEIQRSTVADRATNYATYNNSFRPEALNKDIDRIWLKIQELGVADVLLKIYTDKLHAEQKNYIDDQDRIIKAIINDLKNYLDNQDNTLQNNINNLKSYVDTQDTTLQTSISNLRAHVDQQDNNLNSYFTSLIDKQGVSLQGLKDLYEQIMSQIAAIAIEKGWLASLIVDKSGKTQQQINDVGGYWERKPLTDSANTTFSVLDGQNISIWEFVDEIINKNNSTDPSVWDWSPAIRAAIAYCEKHATILNGKYASATIYFPPQKYRIYSQISVDWSSYNFLTGKPKLRMVGENAYISNMMHETYMFDLKGVEIHIKGFTFINESGGNAFHFKLGDEVIANSTAVTGYFGECHFLSQTKGITFGQVYDCVFDRLFMTGFNTKNATTATGIEILQHSLDNCNNIIFNRLHLETTYTQNYVAFKLTGNTHSSSHHNIHFYGGHFENHLRGSSLLDIGGCAGFSFNGMVFTENGTNTDFEIGTYEVFKLKNPAFLNFNNCIFQSNAASSTTYDAATMKGFFNLYGTRTSPSVLFKSCYFTSQYSNNYQNIETVINARGSDLGNLLYKAQDCVFNDFNRAIELRKDIYSGLNYANRKFSVYGSNDGETLTWGWDNLTNKVDPITLMKLGSAGDLEVSKSIKAQTVEALSLKTIGSSAITSKLESVGNIIWTMQPDPNNTTTNYTTFVAYGSGGLTQKTVGGLLRLDSDTGIRISSVVFPSSTANYNLGKSDATWNNIYTQNAVTVVSDERHKSNIQDIPQELLDAWKNIKFKMWKMNAAINEKGSEHARWHTGYIAQHIKDVLTNAGLEWTRYGLITYESWDATEGQEAVYDSENNLISEAIEPRDAGEIYMLRMEECLVVEAAYQRYLLEKQEARIQQLEQLLSA